MSLSLSRLFHTTCHNISCALSYVIYLYYMCYVCYSLIVLSCLCYMHCGDLSKYIYRIHPIIFCSLLFTSCFSIILLFFFIISRILFRILHQKLILFIYLFGCCLFIFFKFMIIYRKLIFF